MKCNETVEMTRCSDNKETEQ